MYCQATKVIFGAAVGMALAISQPAHAQSQYRSEYRSPRIDSDTVIAVRTTDSIDTRSPDGRVYSGVVDRDVLEAGGRVAIPEGSPVELIARRVSENTLVLDLDSVVIDGERYGLSGSAEAGTSGTTPFGLNERTGEYVGGGALLGGIIGAIAGGGKGAAIGAAAGAAAGAGAELVTSGSELRVPRGSVVTFRLTRPLAVGSQDDGFLRDGVHYHRR